MVQPKPTAPPPYILISAELKDKVEDEVLLSNREAVQVLQGNANDLRVCWEPVEGDEDVAAAFDIVDDDIGLKVGFAIAAV